MPIYGAWQSKPPTGTPVDWSQAINNGLVMDYVCNEWVGLKTYDNAQLIGGGSGATFAANSGSGLPGWNANGISFPASQDYQAATGVTVPGLPATASGAGSVAFSMEVWVALSANPPSLSAIFGFAATTVPNGGGGAKANRAFLCFGGSAPYDVYFWGDSCDWDSGVQWIVDGKPHQYVFTAPATTNGTPTISLYIDGIFKASGAVGGQLATAATSGASEVWIGSRHSGGSNSFVGTFIRGRIWNRALAAVEVQQSFTQTWGSLLYPRFEWLLQSSGTSVTGTGAVTLAPLTVASTATFSTTATGAVTLGALIVADTATFSTTATGAITLAALGVASTATFKVTATGAVTLSPLTVASTATFTTAATGSITLAALSVASTATFATTATGNVTLGLLGVSDSTSFSTTATGSIALAGINAAGIGFEGNFGSGAIILGADSVSATATFASTATGAVTLASLTPAATATFATIASGTVTLAALIPSGAATWQTVGSGSLLLAPFGVVGTGTIATDSIGSGSVTLGQIAVAGFGLTADLDIVTAFQAWWQANAATEISDPGADVITSIETWFNT